MERKTSKLAVAFVVLLLCAAAITTASSQSKAIGRVKVSPPTDATPRPICDVAREARARNSPAAPGLEAQCRAAGGAIVTPIDKKTDASRSKVYNDLKKIDAGSDFTEIRCRGGSGLRFVVVDGRTNSSGGQTEYMTIYFQLAAQPAGDSGRDLQSGQCAFPERAVRQDEPNEIIQEIVAFGQLAQTLHGSPVDRSPTAAENFPDAQNIPQYLGDAKHYWSFFVRQNAPLPSGRFEASYGRYWKPFLNIKNVIRVPGAEDQLRRRVFSTVSLQPDNTIRVRVRYRREYGYRGDTSAFGYIGPTSCDAFSVFAALGSGRPPNPVRISTDSKMEDAGGYYVCSYLVSDLPLNQAITINTSMSSNRGLPTEVWKGGSNPQPPPGQERLIQNGIQNVTLTNSTPRAALVFEMVYAPIPSPPR